MALDLDGWKPTPDQWKAHVYAPVVDAYEKALMDTKVGTDPTNKNVNRLCYGSSDAGLEYGAAAPFHITPPRTTLGKARDTRSTADEHTLERTASSQEYTGAPVVSHLYEHQLDLDALQFIDPPDDYDSWLGILGLLYRLGFTIDEADNWCQRGHKYRLDELLEHNKWGSLNSLAKESPEEARDILRGMAYNRGWRRPGPTPQTGRGPGFQSGPIPDGSTKATLEKPSPIMASLPPQGPMQVPRVIALLVNALAERAACTPRTALTALLGALSALASGDADVEWPNRGDVAPLTLFLLHLAESGSRKSSSWSRAFDSHRRADRKVTARWEEAKAEYRKASAAARGMKASADSDLPVPLDSSPIVLRRDATIEVLVRRLARGRHAQCWETSEAGTLIGGWSLSRDNRSKSLSDLQDLWSEGIVQLDRVRDDVELSVSGARLTIAWSCQPALGRGLILDAASGNGFAGRCLLLADDHLPEYRPPPGNWPDSWSAKRVLEEFSNWVTNLRADQDYVHKGEKRPERTTYRLSSESWEEVDRAGRNAHQEASSENLTAHERSALARVAENITRVAAVLSYYRRARHGGEAVISLDDVLDARNVVRSCYAELRRQGVLAAATADAEAAHVGNDAVGWIIRPLQGIPGGVLAGRPLVDLRGRRPRQGPAGRSGGPRPGHRTPRGSWMDYPCRPGAMDHQPRHRR